MPSTPPLRLRPLLAALALACLSACGGADDGDGGRGVWKPGEEWRMVPQVTIGRRMEKVRTCSCRS